jgi:RNA polymerase sigma factor (TIGR02999 family)
VSRPAPFSVDSPVLHHKPLNLPIAVARALLFLLGFGEALNTAQVTGLLNQWAAGDAKALEKLLPAVYAELHRVAKRYLRRERDSHTLQPTALINEAVERLLGGAQLPHWESRAQLVGIMARAMREVLVDSARKAQAAKRPNRADRLDLDAINIAIDEGQILLIDDSLRQLARLHSRQARVVELKYFGGLTLEEIASALAASEATVTRDWRMARAWLKRHIESVH